MKVDFAEQHVKGSHGLGATKTFGIRTTAHAFKLLSSGLYSDKIAAVLREIGCNAVDAHIQQGTPDRPIEVKLPNRIDPQFYILDHGPGLSHQDVMDMYTTYFASSKQDSNDYTGAFGLGSKSPFSYTDSFTVVSSHGGRKRTYSAHLDNHDAPTIAQLTDEPAEAGWPHGLMVAFPVKPQDFNTFQDRANAVFRWFRVTPDVRGGSRPKKAEFTLERPEFIRVSSANVGVLMGNVFYPLSAMQLPSLTRAGKSVFSIEHVVLKVDIGDVNVAASRENLQYDKPTIKFLVARLDKTGKAIGNEIAERVRRAMTAPWGERCKLTEVKNDWVDGHWFNWHSYFQDLGFSDAGALSEVITNQHEKLPPWTGQNSRFRIIVPANNGTVRHYIVDKGETKVSKRGANAASIEYTENTVLFHGEATFALERVRQEVVQGRVKQAVMITKHPTKGTDKEVEAEVDNFLQTFAGIPAVKIDTLPVPPTKTKGARKPSVKVIATLPLPPMPITVINATGGEVSSKLDSLAPEDQHYMCRTPSWNDGNYAESAVRLYEKTADEDRVISRHKWLSTWKDFIALQSELGIAKSKNHALLTAGEIKAADIVKRQWKWTHTVIKEWLEDPATQAAVVAVASKWRPTISLQCGDNMWLMTLSRIYIDKPHAWGLIRPVLAASPLNFADTVENLAAASKAAGRRAGTNRPAALTLFDQLASALNMQNLKLTMPATSQRNYITPEELEAKIVTTHSVLNNFRPTDLQNMIAHQNDAKLVSFAQLLFN